MFVKNSPINLRDPSGLLFDGRVDAGESYGENAAEYWAERSIDPNNSVLETAFDFTMGSLASLWTPCTSDKTALTLLPTGGGAAAGRALEVEVNAFSKGNVFKIISKKLKVGFRIDPAHHGQGWGHFHFWNW